MPDPESLESGSEEEESSGEEESGEEESGEEESGDEEKTDDGDEDEEGSDDEEESDDDEDDEDDEDDDDDDDDDEDFQDEPAVAPVGDNIEGDDNDPEKGLIDDSAKSASSADNKKYTLIGSAVCCLVLILSLGLGLGLGLKKDKDEDKGFETLKPTSKPTIPPTIALPTLPPGTWAPTTATIPDYTFSSDADTFIVTSGPGVGEVQGDQDILKVANGPPDSDNVASAYSLISFNISEFLFGRRRLQTFAGADAILKLTHVESLVASGGVTVHIVRLPDDTSIDLESLTAETFTPTAGVNGTSFEVFPSDTALEINVTDLIFGIYDSDFNFTDDDDWFNLTDDILNNSTVDTDAPVDGTDAPVDGTDAPVDTTRFLEDLGGNATETLINGTSNPMANETDDFLGDLGDDLGDALGDALGDLFAFADQALFMLEIRGVDMQYSVEFYSRSSENPPALHIFFDDEFFDDDYVYDTYPPEDGNSTTIPPDSGEACEICGEGKVVGNETGIVPLPEAFGGPRSCGDILAGASLIEPAECEQLIALTQEPCACELAV